MLCRCELIVLLNKHINPSRGEFLFALKSPDAWGHIHGKGIGGIKIFEANCHVNKTGKTCIHVIDIHKLIFII